MGLPVAVSSELPVDTTESPSKDRNITNRAHKVFGWRSTCSLDMLLQGHVLWQEGRSEVMVLLGRIVGLDGLFSPWGCKHTILGAARSRGRIHAGNGRSGLAQDHDQTIRCTRYNCFELKWLDSPTGWPVTVLGAGRSRSRRRLLSTSPRTVGRPCVRTNRLLTVAILLCPVGLLGRDSERLGTGRLGLDDCIIVQVHGGAELRATIRVQVTTARAATTVNAIDTGAIDPVDSVHFLVILCREVFFRPGIAEPKAEVRDRVVGLCTLQTPHSICQAIICNAFIKALVLQLLRAQPKNLCNGIGRKHDGQGSGESVENESGPRLSFDRGHLELGREMLQHVVTRIPRRTREDASDLGCIDSPPCGYSKPRMRRRMSMDSTYSRF